MSFRSRNESFRHGRADWKRTVVLRRNTIPLLERAGEEHTGQKGATSAEERDHFWDAAWEAYQVLLDHTEAQSLPFLQFCRFPIFFNFLEAQQKLESEAQQSSSDSESETLH